MKSSSLASSRPVAIWVYTGVIMLLIQVILGGITRLTGSGLSITEWNVMTGAIPPLDQGQWQDAFDKYRHTQQFQLLNSGFSLYDYKCIFFWEWFHRFWARLVGVVFIVGFVWLIWKKKMQPAMIRPLVILFLLGALQGAVGWIMVASGLTGDAIYVQPTKLALHFVFALGLIVYAYWFALQLSVPDEALLFYGSPAGNRQTPAGRKAQSLRRWTIAILVVLFFQLLYGALMAGHKAAAVASTWPTINGDWLPGSLFTRQPLLQDLVGNKITVQFLHRGIAYLLLILVGIWTAKAIQASRTLLSTSTSSPAPKPAPSSAPASAPSPSYGPGQFPSFFRRLRWVPLGLIGVQILLGILSVLTSPGIVPNHWVAFDWLAQLHQVTGLLFLLTMVGMLYLVRTRPSV